MDSVAKLGRGEVAQDRLFSRTPQNSEKHNFPAALVASSFSVVCQRLRGMVW